MGAKLTSLSYLGLAVETTLGTPVAPTGFIPVMSFKPQDDPKYIADTGSRGQPVNQFGMYASVKDATYEIDGMAYPTSFGNLLGNLFGVDTVSGTAAPYTHTFSTADTPGSLTLSDFYVAGFRQWPGCKVTKLVIKYTADAGVSYTASLIGFPSVTGTAPTSETFGTLDFFMGWEAALTLGGTSHANLQSMTITIERQKSDALFSAQNSQTPWDIFAGPMSATWEADFFMQSDAEYTLALSEGNTATSVTWTQAGSGDTMTITSSAVQYTKPTINRSGAFVAVSLTGSANFNATDNSVITAKLTNALATAYTTTAAS